MIIAVTGHRPQWLGQYREGRLEDLAVAALKKHKPSLVITGMALGWDQAAAEAAVRVEIPFLAAVPFPGQEEGWSQFQHHEYHRLLGEALRVEVIGRHTDETAACKVRNRWMVDHSTRNTKVLALWDGARYGDTWHCVWYAQGKGVRVANLRPSSQSRR